MYYLLFGGHRFLEVHLLMHYSEYLSNWLWGRPAFELVSQPNYWYYTYNLVIIIWIAIFYRFYCYSIRKKMFSTPSACPMFNKWPREGPFLSRKINIWPISILVRAGNTGTRCQGGAADRRGVLWIVIYARSAASTDKTSLSSDGHGEKWVRDDLQRCHSV